MSSKFLCDHFVNLIYYNDKLRKDNARISKALADKKLKQNEDNENNLKFNETSMLENIGFKLNEKLETLKLIANNLGRDLIDRQSELADIETIIDLQDEALKKVEFENCSLEKNVNEQIHKMRGNFIEQYSELKDYETKYTEIKILLNESHLEIKAYEDELKIKKIDLNKTKFCIKKLQEKSDKPCDNKNLKNAHVEITKKLNEMSYCINTIIKKNNTTKNELDASRKIIRSKLKITKDYNNWNTDEMLSTKINLIKSLRNDSQKDNEIKVLIAKIQNIKREIKKSNEVIKNFKFKVSQF